MKDILEITGKLGIGGGLGFLLGWLIVWWVEPTTVGGMALLIVIPVAFCATTAGIVSKLRGAKDHETEDKTGKIKSKQLQEDKQAIEYPPC